MSAREHRAEAASTAAFFSARSVAVIGAAREQDTIGQALVRHLVLGESIASLVSMARLGPPADGLIPFAQVTTLGVPAVVGELTAERFVRLRQMWPLVAQTAAAWSGTAITDLGHLVPGNAAVPVAKRTGVFTTWVLSGWK